MSDPIGIVVTGEPTQERQDITTILEEALKAVGYTVCPYGVNTANAGYFFILPTEPSE